MRLLTANRYHAGLLVMLTVGLVALSLSAPSMAQALSPNHCTVDSLSLTNTTAGTTDLPWFHNDTSGTFSASGSASCTGFDPDRLDAPTATNLQITGTFVMGNCSTNDYASLSGAITLSPQDGTPAQTAAVSIVIHGTPAMNNTTTGTIRLDTGQSGIMTWDFAGDAGGGATGFVWRCPGGGRMAISGSGAFTTPDRVQGDASAAAQQEATARANTVVATADDPTNGDNVATAVAGSSEGATNLNPADPTDIGGITAHSATPNELGLPSGTTQSSLRLGIGSLRLGIGSNCQLTATVYGVGGSTNVLFAGEVGCNHTISAVALDYIAVPKIESTRKVTRPGTSPNHVAFAHLISNVPGRRGRRFVQICIGISFFFHAPLSGCTTGGYV